MWRFARRAAAARLDERRPSRHHSPRGRRWAGRCGEKMMAWKTPKIVEVSLALEINSYACAEID
ncbi:pyrroloquinoline quinone precursor peptide PqqA [Falsiroseomonas sp. HW251]|uniref:pyrroloquinoline quinone precursor peptide PqqA n=1 Tax=Falsiroseomonas sp. HW251 TaxID=3390998 RepID=UPI003D31FB98